MKKFVAKLRKNKGTKKYVVHLTSGNKITVRAQGYELWRYNGSGICADLKWTGKTTEFNVAPASVAAVVKK